MIIIFGAIHIIGFVLGAMWADVIRRSGMRELYTYMLMQFRLQSRGN